MVAKGFKCHGQRESTVMRVRDEIWISYESPKYKIAIAQAVYCKLDSLDPVWPIKNLYFE